MSDSTKTRLETAWGYKKYPDDVDAVWSARLIWPDDLLPDRQDLQARNDDAKDELILWLNGVPAGQGAIKQMKEALKTPNTLGLKYDGPEEAVIYEDDIGIIVGSAQSSHGYVYVCGYLK